MRLFAFLALASLSWSQDSSSFLFLQDSSSGRWAQAHVFLAESLQTQDFGSRHVQSSTWARVSVFGEMNSQWSWRTSITAFTDIANRNYPANLYDPSQGVAYNLQDSGRRTWDFTTAYSEYRIGANSRIFGGLDYVRMGPSYRNPVAFRGNQSWFRPWMDQNTTIPMPAPLLYAAFDFGLGRVHYTQYSGQTKYRRDLSRYFHTHQLKVNLPLESEFSLFETIVYGTTVEAAGSNPNHNADSVGRTMEWLYAIPFVPYYFGSHYNGDQDNGALGLSGVFRGLSRWDVYFELMLDDGKSPLSMLDDSWWGNKWALSSGWRWHFLQGPWRGEWRFEWTRIEPWVYTHHQGASHQYTHYGQILGSDLGPNSQEFYTHAELGWKALNFRLSLSSVAKDTAFGSDVSDIHLPTDPTDKNFLARASTMRYQEWGVEFRILPTQWLWFRGAGYKYTGDYSGFRTEASLGVTY